MNSLTKLYSYELGNNILPEWNVIFNDIDKKLSRQNPVLILNKSF